VQLTLDDSFKTIGVKSTTNVTSEDSLASNLNPNEPQFYLYHRTRGTPTTVLIYCCPEKESSVKNRMVYSTCKTPLADQIRTLGVENLKKFDIREPSELTSASLTQQLASSSSAMFSPSNSVIRANNNPNFKPVSYRPTGGRGGVGAVSVMSASANRNAPQGGLASVVQGSPQGSTKLPRGVVLPPKGAYC
jgi:hypothetical protein